MIALISDNFVSSMRTTFAAHINLRNLLPQKYYIKNIRFTFSPLVMLLLCLYCDGVAVTPCYCICSYSAGIAVRLQAIVTGASVDVTLCFAIRNFRITRK
jgi:hypothetical protein